MTWSAFTIARVAGIPIRVHISLAILLPLLLFSVPASLWPLGLAVTGGFFLAIVLHELGHSLIARQFGCGAREILLLPIGGLARLECMPRHPRAEMVMAAAGPVVSLLLSLLFATLAFLTARRLPHWSAVFEILRNMNLTIALFNLIPSFPMDGGRIFRAWLVPRIGRLLATRIAAWLGQAFAVLMILWGIFGGGLLKLFLGLFLFRAASMEWQMALVEHLYGMPEPWAPLTWEVRPEPWPRERRIDDEVIIYPPPYRRRMWSWRWPP
jgi:Zn-dependent protease